MRLLYVFALLAAATVAIVLFTGRAKSGSESLATRAPRAASPPAKTADLPEVVDAGFAGSSSSNGRTELSANEPAASAPESSLASRPDALPDTSGLTVLTVGASGEPIPGAVVGIRYRGEHSLEDHWTAGDNGEVHFDLRPWRTNRPFSVWATAQDLGLASPEVEFAALPDAQPLVLVLEEGGWLDMTVLESVGGLPVEGAGVSVSIEEEMRRALSRSATDADGHASLGPLVPGTRAWYVGAPGAEHNVRGTCEIASGRRTAIEVVLDADGEPLALEGLFVDENGMARPTDAAALLSAGPIDHPELWVGPSRAEGKIVHPDMYGRFRVHMPPCEELIVLLNSGANGHRYVPESLTVPFGTRGLRFRIAERYEKVETRFDVHDEPTGYPLMQARVIIYRDDPWKAQESCITRSKEAGVFIVEHRDWPDLQYLVKASGYGHVYGRLDRSTRADGIRVDVRRGTRSPVVVLDDATLLPIEGARFVNTEDVTIATSDVNGEAELRGDVANGRLRVVASGYVPRRWYASWPTPRVTLVQE